MRYALMFFDGENPHINFTSKRKAFTAARNLMLGTKRAVIVGEANNSGDKICIAGLFFPEHPADYIAGLE